MPSLALRVTATEALSLTRPAELESDFVLSPFVWWEGAGHEMLVRVVNDDPDPEHKVARILRHSRPTQRRATTTASAKTQPWSAFKPATASTTRDGRASAAGRRCSAL